MIAKTINVKPIISNKWGGQICFGKKAGKIKFKKKEKNNIKIAKEDAITDIKLAPTRDRDLIYIWSASPEPTIPLSIINNTLSLEIIQNWLSVVAEHITKIIKRVKKPSRFL